MNPKMYIQKSLGDKILSTSAVTSQAIYLLPVTRWNKKKKHDCQLVHKHLPFLVPPYRAHPQGHPQILSVDADADLK